jgi:ABC-type transport system involved in multi-copper enzyme maturation permease subunit
MSAAEKSFFEGVWDKLRPLFVANPMYAEVQRERNKAMAEHNWRGAQLAARILLIVIYLFLLILTIRWIEYVEPFVLMYVMLGLATILIPAGLHGTIAGEREKRALDLLLVAPVTPGQIIVGKFGKTFLSLALLIVAVGGPALIIELVKQDSNAYLYGQHSTGLAGYFRSLVLVVATSLAMGGLTMWVSSKTKTNSGAMLATVGALFVVLIVVPAMGGVVSALSPGTSEFLLYSNPFVLLYHAYAGEMQYAYDPSGVGRPFQPASYLWPTVTGLTALAVLFLWLATENLRDIARGRTE